MRKITLAMLLVTAAAQAPAQQGDTGMTDPSLNQRPAPRGTDRSADGEGQDWAAIKARYEAESAAHAAAKAAAEARKAAIDASEQEARARIGTVAGQSDITGTVTTNDGTAKAEAMLLATKATQAAAADVAVRLKRGLDEYGRGREVLVLTDMKDLSTADASVFDVQLARFRTVLGTSERICRTALAAPVRTISAEGRGGGDRIAPIAAAGAVLDAVTKLGSYFQSNYTFAGVTIAEPSNLTAGVVVGALREQTNSALVVPANLVASDPSGVIDRLTSLDVVYASLLQCGAEAKSSAGAARASDAGAAALLDAADAAATKAASAYEAFVSALLSSTGDQPPPLVNIMRQQIIRGHLTRRAMILLVTSQKAGQFYTRRNLWTFLGGPPLYTMGGVSMVFTLVDPETGIVVAAGAVAKHGGYQSVGAVQRLFR